MSTELSKIKITANYLYYKWVSFRGDKITDQALI